MSPRRWAGWRFGELCTGLARPGGRVGQGRPLDRGRPQVQFDLTEGHVLALGLLGQELLEAAIDLPLALPTAVAGIALSALFAPRGWIGVWLALIGIKLDQTPLGILVALIFVGLPFVVRERLRCARDRLRCTSMALAGAGFRH